MSRKLPEIEVWLRLEPVPTPDGLQHAVSLHATEPPADGTMRYRVRVSPSVVDLPDGRQGLNYGAAIAPVRTGPSVAPDAFRSRSTDTPEARAAADAVLIAPPDQRYDRLLELIGVLAP